MSTKKEMKTKLDEAATKAETLSLDNPEDLKLVAEGFVEENQELFEMVADRLIQYAQTGNALAVNWMSQSLIGLLKQANESCKQRLGIDEG
ncbi:hypothetical protein KA005_57440, partial [bacterium]|nr:hypothetical protein [bacterium]